MKNDAALKVNALAKAYVGRKIIKGLNLAVPRGQFTVLFGKNGSGKSTLLRLVAGLESADAGEIQLLGSDIEFENVARRQKVAFISETISADPSSSLHQIVNVYSPLQPKWNADTFKKFAHTFNLSLEKRFGSLSRGQKVQFFFALAAAAGPDLYLLDEVTSVLDANARFVVMNHLRAEVAKGASVVLATNIAAETHNFAHEILFLVDGAIGLNCSVDDLQERFVKFRVSAEAAGSTNIPEGSRPVQLNRDGSISYLMPHESAPKEASLDRRGVTIEDVFIYFTGPETNR